MYISELKLWNFRKYGNGLNDLDFENPHLTVPFEKGMNVLIGENDSGKTAIIDAIKLVLKTHAYEWIKVEKSDFHANTEKMRIEIHFSGISNDEAKHFIEWCGWAKEKVEKEGRLVTEMRPKLILIYQAEIRDNRIIPSDVKAGMDGTGFLLNAEAREYLKCTYLKALRDADSELMAKKNSRLSQILQEHKLFKKKKGDVSKHQLEQIFEDANGLIKDYFNDCSVIGDQKSNKEQIANPINTFLKDFIDDNYISKFDITEAEIKSILEKISLGIDGKDNLGLGTMNRLFMAAELLHLKKEKYDGLKLCMIEELEAHLHPQAQMKIIETLDRETINGIQFILTTHSPNIASKVDLKSLIICKDNDVFPMGYGKTKLEEENYLYLKRFLDVTKSNLFFAKGIILVEGWSEEILIPEIAKKMGYDLSKSEISIVNVASVAYLHFAKIFLREDGKKMRVPVAIITDLDNRPDKNGKFEEIKNESDKVKKRNENLIKLKGELKGSSVTLELAKEWTLEWCLFKSTSLSILFKESVSEVHSGTKAFDKVGENFKEQEFQEKLISKLKKEEGTSNLEKVKVASKLAEKIKKDKSLVIDKDDVYLEYITKSIKHIFEYGN